MNKKYIDELFKHNKTGTLLKLIKDNVHNWSIDDFHHVLLKSHNNCGIIHEYLINMFQKRNVFGIEKIVYILYDRIKINTMSILSQNILKYYIHHHSNTNYDNIHIRMILRNIIEHSIYYSYDNKIYISEYYEQYLYCGLQYNPRINHIIKKININKFANFVN